jgi:hypothetical protein
MLRHRKAVTSLFFALLASTGCSAESPRTSGEADLARVTSPLTAEIGSWTDWSGYVQTKAWVCDYTEALSHPHATCAVPDPEYVLVGGGADIDFAGAGDTIALTGSYPDEFLTTWNAESADHLTAAPHRLRAFAIGMKVAGNSAQTLREIRNVVTVTSPMAGHPTATAALPNNYFMVGGGAQALSSGAGQLLIDSHPAGPRSWFAASKDHGVSDPGTVRSIAIGFPIDRFLQSASASASNPIAAGFGASIKTVFAFSGNSFAPSSIGGVSTYNGAGRLLAELRVDSTPNNGSYDFGAEVWSEDLGAADSGNVEAHVLGVRWGSAVPGQTFPGGPPPDGLWSWIAGYQRPAVQAPIPRAASAVLALALLGFGTVSIRSMRRRNRTPASHLPDGSGHR